MKAKRTFMTGIVAITLLIYAATIGPATAAAASSSTATCAAKTPLAISATAYWPPWDWIIPNPPGWDGVVDAWTEAKCYGVVQICTDKYLYLDGHIEDDVYVCGVCFNPAFWDWF